MPIRSTYQVQVSPLGQSQIGVIPEPPKKEDTNWIGIARIITTIAEIGLTMIPGIGPVAATGIAVASAGVYTGLDVAQGSVSGLNMALTWGAAVIPGISQIRSNARVVSRLAAAGELAEKQLYVTQKWMPNSLLDVAEAQSRLRGFQKINEQVNVWMNIDNKLEGIARKAYEKEVAQLGSQLKKEEAVLTELSDIVTAKMGGDFSAEGMIRYIESTASKEEAARIKQAFENMTGYSYDRAELAFFNKEQILQQTNPLNLEHEIEKLKGLKNEALGRQGRTAIGEAADDLQDDVRNFNKPAEYTEVEVELRRVFGNEKIDELVISLQNVGKRQQQSRMMDWIRQNLGMEEAEALILRVDNVSLRPVARQAAPKGWISRHLAALKRPFSSSFAELWVQKLQLVDPNDIGRALPEAIYKSVRKRMARKIEKLIEEKPALAGLKGAAKKMAAHKTQLNNLKKAFKKAGGVLVNSERIIGYKVIHRVGLKTLIMITFNPAPSAYGGTGATHRIWNGITTKNYKGKKPVFVEATAMQLEELREGGFSYYLNTWAFNKGGRPVGGAFFGMGGLLSGMTHLLPWINTTALRSWLSITSNWVENVADMVRGDYGANWTKKFIRSMKRTSISRGGRLLAQGFIRPVIGGRAGFFIGKEMQRILGAVTTGLNNAGDKKKGTFGQRWVKSFKAQLIPRVEQAGVSYTNRAGRKRGAYGTQVRGASRKLSYLRRPISAATPNSFLNPRSFTRFKV